MRARRLIAPALLALLLAACGDDDRSGQGDSADGRDTTPTASRPVEIPLSTRLSHHLDSLVAAGGAGTRAAHTAGNRLAVDYLERELRASGADVRLDSIGRTGLVNVVATLRGATDSVLVIGAHLDASASRDRGWSRQWRTMPAPGAVDNATGVAAVVEIARELRRRRRPRFTVELVAFNAEEYSPNHRGHHLGSRAHAEALGRSGRPFAGAVILDMVASKGGGDRVGLFAAARARSLAAEVERAEERVAPVTEIRLAAAPCSKSDNESFDRLGMPAVLLMESCAPWKSSPGYRRYRGYHTSRDVVEEVNRRVLEDVVRVLVELAAPRGAA